MDQFQGCGLVDGVGVRPVDANLEGLLVRWRTRGVEGEEMRDWKRGKQVNQTTLTVSDCILETVLGSDVASLLTAKLFLHFEQSWPLSVLLALLG